MYIRNDFVLVDLVQLGIGFKRRQTEEEEYPDW